MSQEVEHLLSKPEAQSSNLVLPKKKKKKRLTLYIFLLLLNFL
jgi:hypothetical protein